MKFDNLNDTLLLYAVTDRHWLGEETLADQVRKALDGGATFLQLREKNLDREHFLEEAKELRSIAREYHVPFVINDNVEVALAMDADGVHVGQDDMASDEVRRLIGPDKILGVSAGNVEEAKLAEANGADYLGVGTIFPTSSKDDAKPVTMEMLREICESVSIPVIAIGGITKDNLAEMKGTGIVGIAVISAIFGAEDIEAATRELHERTSEMVQA